MATDTNTFPTNFFHIGDTVRPTLTYTNDEGFYVGLVGEVVEYIVRDWEPRSRRVMAVVRFDEADMQDGPVMKRACLIDVPMGDLTAE